MLEQHRERASELMVKNLAAIMEEYDGNVKAVAQAELVTLQEWVERRKTAVDAGRTFVEPPPMNVRELVLGLKRIQETMRLASGMPERHEVQSTNVNVNVSETDVVSLRDLLKEIDAGE